MQEKKSVRERFFEDFATLVEVEPVIDFAPDWQGCKNDHLSDSQFRLDQSKMNFGCGSSVLM